VQKRWKAWHRGDFLAQTETVLEQIARHGPLGSGEVGANERRGTGGWWDWHPSKTALEYLWRTGRITVSRREGFRKLYDLTENVIPQDIRSAQPSLDDSKDWACQGALRALGFATAKEVSDFYDFVTVPEARAWIARGIHSGLLREIKTEAANGQLRDRVVFTQDWPKLQEPLTTSNRLRILSPFDPALRNRARAEEIFGFSYRIEVFVPAAQRQYGYYVFPILEGNALIARIEIKANRKKNAIEIIGLWPEATVKFTPARLERLIAELKRICPLAECRDISGLEILRSI
ncbi:MAG: crosslink repair DNA glycosylase YcaQ family protein, partial [Planktomarina sp.]|nr:crosslink repair DNA glycosylase YcaQ family protein [Planktomarina sp.]